MEYSSQAWAWNCNKFAKKLKLLQSFSVTKTNPKHQHPNPRFKKKLKKKWNF